MEYIEQVIKAQEGDIKSCEYLVNCFQEMAISYAYSILHDFGLSEDAAQEAFLLMLNNLKALKEPKAFISWFRKLIFTSCIRIMKKLKKEVTLDEALYDLNSDPLERSESNERKILINQTLSKLSKAQQEAIVLHYFYDKPYSEIAEYLNITEAAVSNRIYYGKKKVENIILSTMIDYLGEYIMDKNTFTKKVINDYKVSFSYINEMTYINCFASVYTYLNKNIYVKDYQCQLKDDKHCNDCGNCKDFMRKTQEKTYYLFDTVSGNSSIRPNFAGTNENIDNKTETIDFLMKFTGYEYMTLTKDFNERIRSSIDENRPVIAKMKGDVKGNFNNYFRVLIGYENDGFLFVENNSLRNNPNCLLKCDNFSEVIIITNIDKPKYTLLDCFKQIKSIMEINLTNGIWDECIQKFNYWDELKNANIEEVKKRYSRICEISYYNFNCHNFSEVFGHRLVNELEDDRLDEVCRQIDRSYDKAHAKNWQIIGLNEYRDWSKHGDNMREWGYCSNVAMCLEKLKEYDAEVLLAVEKAISILEIDNPAK